MYDITRVKADLEATLHGTSVNQLTNLYGLLNRASRDVLADVDPAETKRIMPLASAIFGSVYDYQCPVDLKGDRIIDVFPVGKNRGVVQQKYNQDFDLHKGGVAGGTNLSSNSILTGDGTMTVLWNTGNKFLRLSVPSGQSQLLHDCDTIDQNGLWSVGGPTGFLDVDQLNKVQGAGALRAEVAAFNLALEDGDQFIFEDGSLILLETGGSTDAYFENSTLTTVDLTQMEDEGSIFAWVFLPAADSATNVSIRWGSSPDDYWQKTVTTTQEGTAFAQGWNLLRFDWRTALEVGVPEADAVNYLRVTVAPASLPQNPIRIDAISAQLGSLYQIEYYSKYLFRDALTGAFKETVTSDSDVINLDTDSYQLYFNRVMYLASQQVQGQNSANDSIFFEKAYEKSLQRYKAKYKSEIQAPNQDYYPHRTTGYGKFLGRRYR